ncbi:type VII secretion system-associated protein [Saccharopolyspora oryzae]|uniref:Type VII secretion system-associated protein n=1 Tax=Saccharopolyspora oryzae TaxID=2997343 RepID=A0ABT4V1C9_9PSEU|nr:type VII secretion system-associated protein [Saccharopolyspora oryzae]MDA3627773.1 type VII secretion system-associated protein [Saccharopolyspora oryzae]
MDDSARPSPGSDRDDWAVLLDPAWQPRFDGDQPPPHAIAGGWPLATDGSRGRFEPNPDFAPADPANPTDPVDAVLRLIAEGRTKVDELIPAVRDAVLEIALSADGYPLVGPAPDDVPCVAVVTAPLHRKDMDSVELWGSLTAEGLLELLPPDTDILLNPEGPAPVRLAASALRDSFA